MRLTLRTMALAIGSTGMIGTSAAHPQTPPAYYYPAPGDYASAVGTVHIPAAGYYYNAPLYAVPAPRYPAPTYARLRHHHCKSRHIKDLRFRP